ncbi:MAG: chorismate synthase [Gemmataceae bacterium]|nr:chorismate synthase [Gemmataceae bacterium]
MAGNTFGTLFAVTTAGESHGPGYVCVIDGCPAGLDLSADDLLPDLRRRRPGQSKLTTQRKEEDAPELLSGVFEGRTTGTSIAILFRNSDQRSGDYGDIADKYRPGHADYTFDAKYGFRDYRGGGRSSARETVCRVAAGAVAKKLLARDGIRVLGYVTRVGDVAADIPDPTAVTLEQVEASPTRCPVPDAAARMEALIDAVRKDRDSIGGVCELAAVGVPPGLGEPVFDKLKADLAKALLSLPAVVGFEYGAGFALAGMRGSEANDHFVPAKHPSPGPSPTRGGEQDEDGRLGASSPSPSGGGSRGEGFTAAITTATNRHGGMLGGISSGLPVVCRVALKPTSSIPRPQPTVTRAGEPTELLVKGRHDPCLLPRFVPMGEAMVALVLVDHLLRHRAARLG